MLLLLAIVQSEDASPLAKRLLDKGLRLTRINSSGGLLGVGNVALLLGIEDERYGEVLTAIEATCRTRLEDFSAIAIPEHPILFGDMPLEVEVGGAVVFGIPVERFVHIPGVVEPARRSDRAGEVDDEGGRSTLQEAGLSTERQTRTMSGQMKLIVAIVRGEEADPIIRTLLAAEHRLTRINTSGGFLRRGNATLLIGVKPEQVDEVINLIESASPRRSDSAPIEKGIPEYTATLFVLDASHFIRV